MAFSQIDYILEMAQIHLIAVQFDWLYNYKRYVVIISCTM